MEIFSDRRKVHNKIIALILALLIAVTPLLSNVGGESGVKAADEAGRTIEYTLQDEGLNRIIESLSMPGAGFSGIEDIGEVTCKDSLFMLNGDTLNINIKIHTDPYMYGGWTFIAETTESEPNLNGEGEVYDGFAGMAGLPYEELQTTVICKEKTQFLVVYAINIAEGGEKRYPIYCQPFIAADSEYAKYAATVKNGINQDSYYKELEIPIYDNNREIPEKLSVITGVGDNGELQTTTYYPAISYAKADGTPQYVTAEENAAYKLEADGAAETYTVTMGLVPEKTDGSAPDTTSFEGKTTYFSVNLTNDEAAPTIGAVGLRYSSGSKDAVTDFYNTDPGAYAVTSDDLEYTVTVSDGDGIGIGTVKYNDSEEVVAYDADLSDDNSSVYTIPISKWTSGASLVVTDKAGNEKSVTLRRVAVVNPDMLTGVEYEITGLSSGKVTGNNAGGNSLDAGELYSKSEADVDIAVTVKTGRLLTEFCIKTGTSTLVSYTGADLKAALKEIGDTETYYTYKFTYKLRGNAETKSLKDLSLAVTYSGDSAKAYTIADIYCDSVEPEMPKSTLQYYDSESGKWADCDSSNLYLDTSRNEDGSYKYKYRYKITNVEDDSKGLGLADSVETTAGGTVKHITRYLQISASSEKTWSNENETELDKMFEEEGNTYYHILTAAEMASVASSGDGGYTAYVKVKDKTGNVRVASLPALKNRNTEIKFSTIELRDSSNNTKTFGSVTPAVNETYKLYVTVTSGWTLAKKVGGSDGIILRKTSDSGTVTEFSLNNATLLNEAYEAGRYTSQLVFDLPAKDIAATDNAQYDKITLYVKDVEKNAGETTLGQLIYDNSKPYVSRLDYKSGWVKADEAVLSYEIVSGSSSAAESRLTSASYTLEGVYNALSVSGPSVSGSVTMPESKNTEGTSIEFWAADDAGNTLTDLKPNKVTMYVDGHDPAVTALTVNGKTAFAEALSGAPVISTGASDNLALSKIEAVVDYPDGTAKTYTKAYDANNGLGVDITDDYSFQIENTGGMAADGAYTVTVTAYDKAGNKSLSKILQFSVDNTVPVVSAVISGGTKGGKQARNDGTDYYYSSNVEVTLTVVEENFVSGNVTVTDKAGNGSANKVNVTWTKSGDAYVAAYTAVGEGRHVISISATDPTGNQAVSGSVDFVIDKTAPTLSFTLNGLAYTESRGLVYLTSDAQLTAAVSDMTDDANDFNIQIIQKKPDQAAKVPSYLKTKNRSFSFSEEADYTINVYSADMAGNKSLARTITFRVDKTAPELSITGTAGGGTSANATAVTFSVLEAFWQDASGQVKIYRKAGDGKEETLYKTIDVKPTAYLTSVTENLSETGIYRFEFTASDKAGHKVETSQSYTIDRDAPLVSLTGVNNYDITDKSVQFMAQITDDFYSSKKVTLKGTVTGMDGKKKTIDFGSFNQSGNPTVISREFEDDGVYDIEVTSTDAAGNSHSSKVHFTIDKTDPEIGDIKIIDGSVINSVDLDFDLDELISDLTVCNAHMYLNGSEYDGVSDIEDGSYTLLITAEDEMGHYVEKSVSFVLDTKAPVFIVTGVEDGDVKNEEYSIGVSLQLAEDMLSSVTLNGKPVEVTDNTASITVSELGSYTLEMSAVDLAGNTASQKISFTCGEEETATASNWWIWLIIVAGVVIIGFTVYATVKKNEKEQ